MPKLKCEAQSRLTPLDAFAKIKGLLETDRELRAMDPSYVCEFDSTALSGSAKGSKFQAQMTVASADGGSRVSIEVSLPLLLTPLKGVVQSTLQKKMATVLSGD